MYRLQEHSPGLPQARDLTGGQGEMSKRAGKLVEVRGLEMVWDSGVEAGMSRVVRTRLLWWSG